MRGAVVDFVLFFVQFFPMILHDPNLDDNSDAQPGQLLARGAARHLASLGIVSISEFIPARGLRVDLMALGPKGEIWIIECKSCLADFQSDKKWQGYLEWCDRFFWAVDAQFPVDILPGETGLIITDAYGGETVRDAPLSRLSATRRKSVVGKFAQTAAMRLQRLSDPYMQVSR